MISDLLFFAIGSISSALIESEVLFVVEAITLRSMSFCGVINTSGSIPLIFITIQKCTMYSKYGLCRKTDILNK